MACRTGTAIGDHVTAGGQTGDVQIAGAVRRDGDLNERELAILRCVVEGLSNKKIAEREWLAEQTVKFHLSHIYRKLGVSSRTEAVAAACQSGLIEHLPATTAPAHVAGPASS